MSRKVTFSIESAAGIVRSHSIAVLAKVMRRDAQYVEAKIAGGSRTYTGRLDDLVRRAITRIEERQAAGDFSIAVPAGVSPTVLKILQAKPTK